MEANELLKKIRKIEIKTRGLSQNIFAGEYHSAFKDAHLQGTWNDILGSQRISAGR